LKIALVLHHIEIRASSLQIDAARLSSRRVLKMDLLDSEASVDHAVPNIEPDVPELAVRVDAFKIGDKAVYPAHGVGEVTAIENREISGTSQTFYILRILDNGMKIMIPTTNVEQVGLREVIEADKVDEVYDILREKGLSVDTTTWNRRYREYMEKIKTGSVFEVAEVLRDLYLLKTNKDLSFCELKLLDTARGLLIKELSVARNCDEEDVENEFRKIFRV
jgi:CarD family transcriptional regulator